MPRSGSKSRKSKPVLWSHQARHDLEKIFDHVADHFSTRLAGEVTGKIILEVGSLSEFPRKGGISLHFSGIRELIVDSNTVYYRNNEADVVIASIRPRKTATKKSIE